MKEIRESMKLFQQHDPMKEIRESMKLFQQHDPMKEIRESMKLLQPSNNSINVVLNLISTEKWGLDSEDFSEFQCSEDGSISIGSNSATHQQIQDIVHQVTSNTFDEGSLHFEQAIDRILAEIRTLREPYLQKILSFLIYSLIVGLFLSAINPVTDYYIKKSLSSGDKREIVKNVRKTLTREVSEKSLLSAFKIVTADVLIVRKLGAKKSKMIGKLYFSSVVEVLEKKRSWSLVVWHDEENQISLQGWVFSTHLKAIK